MPICATSSCRTTTRSSLAHRPIPRASLSHSAVASDLDQLLAEEGERLVGRDNVVSFEGRALHLAKQRGRRGCA